uniref:HDC06252 n=1 Tax=Drosophila melanogaster TaxID=7227 RepID=Q6IGH7_DROME|nr:TPA_inf: HDC06252 [Drosophila melanogaster]
MPGYEDAGPLPPTSGVCLSLKSQPEDRQRCHRCQQWEARNNRACNPAQTLAAVNKDLPRSFNAFVRRPCCQTRKIQHDQVPKAWSADTGQWTRDYGRQLEWKWMQWMPKSLGSPSTS